mmetsp:Transcript_39344/g.70925  ORF Transcript_39344/g.70925 Transcript_39344/m.70925 type:complete len:332 (+) Transcript_39344:1-996(+)
MAQKKESKKGYGQPSSAQLTFAMPQALPPAIRVCLMDFSSFLDMKGLARFEQAASLGAHIRSALWKKPIAVALDEIAIWAPSTYSILEQMQEQCISWGQCAETLKLLQRAMLPSPELKPWITSHAFSKLQIASLCPGCMRELHCRLENDLSSLSPLLAAIPVTVGAFRGKSFAISMRLEAKALLGDDVCLGIEMRSSFKPMRVMLAPFSGRCYMEHTSSKPSMWMWNTALEALDVNLPIQVWLQVFESGAIRFLRQAEGRDIEDAGLLPAEQFPSWITSYFACVYTWCLPANALVTLSVDYASDRLPPSLAEPVKTMDSVWKLLEVGDYPL